jgi:hypothetical protein
LWTIALKGVLNQWNVIGDMNDIVFISKAVSKGKGGQAELKTKRRGENRAK